MTTAHPLSSLATRERQTGSRILSVIRLQFINTQTFIWVPLLVLAGAIVCSLLIYLIIPVDEPLYGGGAQAPMWVFLTVGIQALTLSLPFSQAMSVTRREFYIGTVAAAAISAAGLATVYLIIAGIEQLTNGYGGIGYIAHLPWFFADGWAQAWLAFFMFTLFAFVAGFWFATVFKRWGPLMLTAVIIGLSLLLILAVFIVTRLELWPDVVTWFATTGPGLFAVYGLIVTAALGVGSYLTLRRTVV